jgi:23S rRNA pseudouridine1911/1915/1917 synthase
VPIASKKCDVAATQAGRVDLVVQTLTSLPRRQVRGLFDRGCVFVNGQPCEQTYVRVGEGDAVEVKYDTARRYHEEAKPKADSTFRIVFEDEDLIVVDKAAHILTVPTPAQAHNTLVNRVSRYLTRGRADDEAYACHRLDRGVSGLLVIGKSSRVASMMRDLFERHEPERRYVAIVAGEMDQMEGTFRNYLATGDNLHRYSTTDQTKGELAVTHYRVEKTLKGATLVRVWLETGRRNQIRVHFSEAGHPVLGDPRYCSAQAKHPRWLAKRIALHAELLGFTHPVTGKKLTFESPLPMPFERMIGR